VCADYVVLYFKKHLSLSLSLSVYLSLSDLTWRLCRVETFPQSNPHGITDIFQYCIRITTRFLRIRIFQPKLKMDSTWFPLLFIHYTNCIIWLSGVSLFLELLVVFSSPCSPNRQCNPPSLSDRYRHVFPRGYPKIPICIDRNNHLCSNNINTVFTAARHLPCPELLESSSHTHTYFRIMNFKKKEPSSGLFT